MKTLRQWWENRKRAKTAQYRWITGRYLTPQEEADIRRQQAARG